MRTVRQPLVWARACERPLCIRKGRVRGVKALGVRYENNVARRMTWAKQGQWFEFMDAEGKSFCQIDLLWDHGDRHISELCYAISQHAAPGAERGTYAHADGGAHTIGAGRVDTMAGANQRFVRDEVGRRETQLPSSPVPGFRSRQVHLCSSSRPFAF